MKILMVLDREFPHDERVEKEAVSLIESGHEVHIACISFLPADEYDLFRGIHIHRKQIASLTYTLSAACLLIPVYFIWWDSFLQSLCNRLSFDVVHVHDLPLTKPGYKLKKKYNLKLVCDQHEYYSNWIVHTAHYNKGLGKIVNRLTNWKRYEKKYLHRADLVITVEDPLRDMYIQEIGIETGKIITVPNTPDLSIFENATGKFVLPAKFKNRFILVYAGGIDTLRGLEMVLDAVSIVKDKIPEILFLVAGKEQKNFSIEAIVRKRLLEDYVYFAGWMNPEKLVDFLRCGHIGVFTPLLNREEIHKTIPTKIYQYCACGLPVLISPARMMKEFVESKKVGYSVESAADLADKISYLYTDHEKYQEARNNGLKISQEYNWSRTVREMIHAYSDMSRAEE